MYTEVLATPCLETTPFSLVMERTGETLTIPVAYTGCSFWETDRACISVTLGDSVSL